MHITNANIARLFLESLQIYFSIYFSAQNVRNTEICFVQFLLIFFRTGLFALSDDTYGKKTGARAEMDLVGMKRIVDGTSDITAMDRLSLRGKCICARTASEYSRSRRRTARQRQIMRGFHRCIPFMQIFMKFSWSGRDTSREVRTMSSKACPWGTDMLR